MQTLILGLKGDNAKEMTARRAWGGGWFAVSLPNLMVLLASLPSPLFLYIYVQDLSFFEGGNLGSKGVDILWVLCGEIWGLQWDFF